MLKERVIIFFFIVNILLFFYKNINKIIKNFYYLGDSFGDNVANITAKKQTGPKKGISLAGAKKRKGTNKDCNCKMHAIGNSIQYLGTYLP